MENDSAREFFRSYQLLGQIGTGGAAQVFRGRHIHPAYADREFSIKLLHADMARDPETMERFRQEAYVLSMLEHANIVRTFEAGIEGDELFIAMEFVDGYDLHEILRRYGEDPPPRFVALYLVGEILKGLGYAHSLRDSRDRHLRLVHRDIKPSNLLVSFSGEVKITDFGVATLLGEQILDSDDSVLGTRGYIAPEALRGEPIDHRADLYAVGVILYELVCGISPFEADKTSKFLRNAIRAKIHRPRKVNPDLDPELESILVRALERRPDRRFADAQEMMTALVPFLPNPTGLPLALGSFLRGLFALELTQAMRRRQAKAPADATVVVYASRANGPVLGGPLQDAGLRVEIVGSVVTLERALAGQPKALVIDLHAQGVLSGALDLAWKKHTPTAPVIVACDELEPALIRAALSVGAVDILIGPYRPDRVVTAVQSALIGAPPPVAGSGVARDIGESDVRVRVVSKDRGLGAALAAALTQRGYRADLSTHPRSALEETRRVSHHGVIYDLGPDADGDLAFADRFRRCPGMATVPVMYLVPPGAPRPPLPELCAVGSRTDAPAKIIAALNELRLGSESARIFQRFECSFAADLRYGGRSYAARAVNISRGGVLLRCLTIPPVGRAVRVGIKTGNDEIEMVGVMVRVEPPAAGEHGARLAVAFRLGSPRIEARLVTLIATLTGSDSEPLVEAERQRIRR